ncbi:hypothetical protein AA0473_1138 [Acetobacter orleanensis NRIC 0473]|uniref:Uncharacterized protein n=2 Tax=Acetobacter orleanensis TaxID=104099 RepID=A0A4Y3TJZ6_9PROT|nr:hypothetical protein [Acetobacter orleanensis]GAN67498.1 hypothetical protein Abol_003_124 [Acetobacter orleanensis JCM 7639]GBR26419.1 hypothetical protein AA0473_1138 [Acetobacter orleanensis NRIC 0473]KXV62092.1 hypothetical protein AD949_12630 [Acetobacter orleanensis]PCD80433.1 hypothetical protein CO710_01345 [Acetobacter orleanensis]GEB81789.1 hypothetical protein AOR01nite_02660 [Acetobacter orleanensis]
MTIPSIITTPETTTGSVDPTGTALPRTRRTEGPQDMDGKLLRLGIVIATLVLGIFLVSSIYSNFSHLMEQQSGQAGQPAANNAPAPQPS